MIDRQHRARPPLEDVKLAGTAPTGWEVSFDPKTLASVKPNETAQVTADHQARQGRRRRRLHDHRAVERRQRVVATSTCGSPCEGSRTLGFVAIGVIVVAFVAARRRVRPFGRR